MSAKKRFIAILKIPCEEHGPHTVTVSSDDEVAFLVGDFAQAELPFDKIEQEQYTVKVYSPLGDFEGF